MKPSEALEMLMTSIDEVSWLTEDSFTAADYCAMCGVMIGNIAEPKVMAKYGHKDGVVSHYDHCPVVVMEKIREELEE